MPTVGIPSIVVGFASSRSVLRRTRTPEGRYPHERGTTISGSAGRASSSHQSPRAESAVA